MGVVRIATAGGVGSRGISGPLLSNRFRRI